VLPIACAVLGGLAGMLVPAITRRLTAGSPNGGAPGDSDGARGGRVRAGPGGRVWVPLGALVFGGLAWALGPVPLLVAALFVAATGLPLAAIDLTCLRLPDPLVGAALLGAGAVLCATAVMDGDGHRLLRCALAGLCTAGAYGVLMLVPRTGLGLGDAKLSGVLGFLLGWLGWPAVLLGLVLPYLCNGPVVLALLLTGRVRRDTPLPFGPALLVGAYLTILLIR
jgi:leader peptidase (prepilin peptidase)/N-methyltransferase